MESVTSTEQSDITRIDTAPQFGRYVPRLVREWLRDDPETVHRQLAGTMVFVDVSGFTKMSERLARLGRVGAEEVTEVIGACFGRLLDEAYAHGGSLVKFGGDALLLFFRDELHEIRAAAAALAMRRTLSDMRSFETSVGKVILRMSVGVHTGDFDFFLLGDSHRELVVAGPAASQVVRTQEAAATGRILVSAVTAANLPAQNLGPDRGSGRLLRGSLGGLARKHVEFRPAEEDLAPYVPSALRARTGSDDLEPEHRSVTVGFIRFRGLDPLIQSSGAEIAAEAVEELVGNVQRTVDRHEVCFLGTDIAADGGKIILTAGAPSSTGQDEEQMLLALRQILDQHPPLAVQVGVNVGHVFAGEIGTSFRSTYTVMGDAVNLAARLVVRAEPGQILATPDVLAGSRTLFEVTPLEPFSVKGKRQPVDAFAVGAPEGSRGAIAEAGLPLIGRDRELETLHAGWESAQAGQGRLVELRGEAGMGKSRLLEEFLSTIGEALLLSAECRLYQSTTPFFPFRALLRLALGLEGLDESNTVPELESLVRVKAPELIPWLPLIGVPLGVSIPDSEETRLLEDEFRRIRLEEAVSSLLCEVLTDPVVIVIEDTHWMDEVSRDLLDRLAQDLGDRPWLFILSRRPGDGGFVAPDDDETVTRLELQPLAVDQTTVLINAATGDAPLIPQMVRALADRAQGHPLFLIELLDALRRGEDVEALPHSVEGLIQARIDRLVPGDRTLLRHVSVLGSGFRAEHAAAVLPMSRAADPQRALRRLVDFLDIQRTGWIQFRHALIRDVAYQGLPYRTRQQLHAQVAESILQTAGSRPEDQAELLSVHYSEAKRWEEAWTYSRIAGDAAKEIHANLEAARFYEQMLHAARYLDSVTDHEKAQVWTDLGDVREQAGLFDAALEAYRKAGPLLGADPVAHAELALRRARARGRTGFYSAALRDLTTGLRLVESLTTRDAARERARLLALSGSLRLRHEQPRRALSLAERAMQEAQLADDRASLARAYTVLDGAYQMLGQLERAVYAAKALEIYEDLGDLLGVARTTNDLGVNAYFEGKWDTAVDLYSRCRDAFQQAGSEANAAYATVNVGEVLVNQGRLEEAEPVLREAIRVLRAYNLVDQTIFAEIQLGRLLVDRGQLEEAEGVLGGARAAAAGVGRAQSALLAGIYLALADIRGSEAAKALERLAKIERALGDEGELLMPLLLWVKAQGLVAQGRLQEAVAPVTRGLELARARGLLYEELVLRLAGLEIARRAGVEVDPEDAQEAERLLERLGVVGQLTGVTARSTRICRGHRW